MLLEICFFFEISQTSLIVIFICDNKPGLRKLVKPNTKLNQNIHHPGKKCNKSLIKISILLNKCAFRLQKLKDDVVMKALPSSNIRKFHVHWNSRGISPNDVPEHAEYIDNLCKEVESLMKEQITNSIHKKVKNDVGDPLYDEVVQHLLFCQTKCSTFHGRKEILDRCRTYLQVNLFYYC